MTSAYYFLVLIVYHNDAGCQIGGGGVKVAQDLPVHFFATPY